MTCGAFPTPAAPFVLYSMHGLQHGLQQFHSAEAAVAAHFDSGYPRLALVRPEVDMPYISNGLLMRCNRERRPAVCSELVQGAGSTCWAPLRRRRSCCAAWGRTLSPAARCGGSLKKRLRGTLPRRLHRRSHRRRRHPPSYPPAGREAPPPGAAGSASCSSPPPAVRARLSGPAARSPAASVPAAASGPPNAASSASCSSRHSVGAQAASAPAVSASAATSGK